jgi:ParB family chromosome partitioning protein
MSGPDKARVKAAVARFAADPSNTWVRPADLAALVKAEIGIEFGASTIARYLAGLGWVRSDAAVGILYKRPASLKKTGAPAAADAPIPDSEPPVPAGVSEPAARSDIARGTIPTGTGRMQNMRITVPLNKLFLSPRNVRKTNGDEDIESLADSIHEKGLLENLVVSERDTGRGFYDVDAGGRRLRALNFNAKKKRIARDFPVDVLVVPAEDAAEASLAENMHTIAMNPADEVIGFGAVIESYANQGIADRREQRCARRFGKTVRYIEERLRLAALDPEILEALRLGVISVDAAKAYAAYPDQQLQQKVFAAQEAMRMHGSNKHSVAAIRAAMAGKIYRRGDRQVRYMGLDAYMAAGGRVELELFMGNEDEEVLIDTALVDRLCRAKAEAEILILAEKDGFLAGGLWGWGAHSGWPKLPSGSEPIWQGEPRLTPKERAETIGIYWITDDGAGLELSPHIFRKKAATAPGTSSSPRAMESEIDRLSRIRREKIEERAVRLAIPSFAGTGLEERVVWPPDDAYHVEKVQRDADGNYAVAVLIFVPKADVEAVMAQAERSFDEDEAAAQAAKAKAAGQGPAAAEQSDAAAERTADESVS